MDISFSVCVTILGLNLEVPKFYGCTWPVPTKKCDPSYLS